MTENELSNKVIDLAIDVHRILGPGLLESAYEEFLFYKIIQTGLRAENRKQCRWSTRKYTSNADTESISWWRTCSWLRSKAVKRSTRSF